MADKTFEVLLKTTADRTGAQQTKADLQDLKNEARGDGPGGGLDPVNLQRQRDSERELATQDQASGIRAEERIAQEERRNSILVQRQALISTEVEALTLEAAGQTEAAAALTAEVELRRAALQIQQSTNLSEEESLVLARQRISAEEQIAAAQLAQKEGSLLAGINIGRARQEATTLVREIAAGGVQMRTVGALAGSLGPALGISAIAALVVGEVISSIGKKLDDNRISSEKESVELQKQVHYWRDMATAAQDFSDVQKLTEDISKRISDINEKIRQTPGETGGGFFETELNGLKLISNFFGTEFETSTDQAIGKQRELAAQIEATGKVYTDLAKRNADFANSVARLPLGEQITAFANRLSDLQREQEGVNRSTAGGERAYQRLQVQIDATSRSVVAASKEQEKADLEIQRRKTLEDELTKATADPVRFAAIKTELEKLDLGLKLRRLIKDAADKAKDAGIQWSKDESEAIEAEIKGPLQKKLTILQEITKRGGPGAPQAQAQIDQLIDKKVPSVADSERKFYDNVLKDDQATIAEKQRAKANLDLLDQAALRALDAKKPTVPRLSIDQQSDALERKSSPTSGLQKGAAEGAGNITTDVQSEAAKTEQIIRDAINRATKAGLESIQSILPAAHAEALFGPITQAVEQSSKSIDDGIPPVVTAVDTLSSTLATGLQGIGTAVVALDGKFATQLQNLQTQINDLYQSQS